MVEFRYDMAAFVMGMHRSGTSALTRVLMLLHGDGPSAVLEPNSANQRGFWESPEINAVNQTILDDYGTNWHSIAALPGEKLAADALRQEAVRRIVADQFPDARRPVIKDPRICRLAPLWIEALKSEARDLVFPFVLRNPVEVAGSLSRRNKFSTALGLNLWARHYLDAERATRDQRRGLIRYADLLADWRNALGGLRDLVELDLGGNPAAKAVDAFLTPDLHHEQVPVWQADAELGEFPMVAELWVLLNEWAETGSVTLGNIARFDSLREDFDRVAPLMDTLLEQQRVLEKRPMEEKKAKREEAAASHSEFQPVLAQIARLQDDQNAAVRSLEHNLKAIMADLEAARKADIRIDAARLEAERERATLRNDHERAVSALHRAMDATAGREREWRKRLDAAKLALNETALARDTALQQATDLQSSLDSLARRLEDLAAQARVVVSHDAAGEAFAHTPASTGDQAQDACALVQAAIAAAHQLQADLADARSEIRRLVDERDAALDKVSDAHDELVSVRLSLHAELDAAREETAAAWQEVASMRQVLEAAEQERDAAIGEIAASRAETLEVRADLKEVTRKYRTTQATLTRTKAGLDRAKERAATFKELAQRTRQDLDLARAAWPYRLARALAVLWASIVAPFAAMLARTRHGRRNVAETIAGSGLFDRAWYLERYPDVAGGSMDPLQHFVRFGWKELRDPGPDFSASRYLRENPDVAQAGLNPVLHFIEFGQAEGRSSRKSKLSNKPAETLPVFAPAAPVYVPAPSATPLRALAPVPATAPLPASFDAVAAACAADAGSAAALARFQQLCGIAAYDAASWEDAFSDGNYSPADAWFVNGTLLRMRWNVQDEPRQVVVCQFDPATRTGALLATTDGGDGGSGGDLLDVTLLSAYHPLLVAEFAPSGVLLHAFAVAFPSLFRNGPHHADFLSEIARPSRGRADHPLAHSAWLADSLAAIRDGALPAVARIAVELEGAIGTGPLFDPAMRGWLRDIFDILIEPAQQAKRGDGAEGGEGAEIVAFLQAGERYLTGIVGQEGTPRPGGGTLFIHGDAMPSVSILCATMDREGMSEGKPEGDVCVALSEAFVRRDPSQPSFAFMQPPSMLRGPCTATTPHLRAPHFRGPRLKGSFAPRKPLPAAAISPDRGSQVRDAEILFPVSSIVALTSFRPSALRMIVPVDGAGEHDLDRSLEALAMQDCASAIRLVLLGDPGEGSLGRARRMFDGRVDQARDLRDALADGSEEFCGILSPGIVPHDGRTLSLLADMVTDGAASASCPLVSSSRLGKSWSVKVAANGLFPETPRGPYAQAEIASSCGLWRHIYPVREPIAQFWLTSRDKLARWVFEDVHQLARDDGEHWCTALTTVSLTNEAAAPSMSFQAPIADPACFAAVRVLNG